jgi:hypothetical protein
VDLVVAANYQGWIRPIQVFILGFVFLFFIRVVRAIMVESKAPAKEKREDRAAAAAAAAARRSWLYLSVVEPAAAAGERFPLSSTLTVGRSDACDVNLAFDQFASTNHATFERKGDQVVVVDHGSTNGVWIDGERIAGPTRVKRGDRVQIGETIFEVTR